MIEDETSVVNGDAEEDHGLLTSPLVTREILELSRPLQSSQYGLLGRLVSIQYVINSMNIVRLYSCWGVFAAIPMDHL